jgi:hypothetical protein
MIGDIRDGFLYMMRHEGIRPTVIILSALSLLPFTVEMILPSLADGVYGQGAHGLAWMTSILGVGAMVQATLIARRGGVSGLSAYAIRAILWMGLAFVALYFAEPVLVGARLHLRCRLRRLGDPRKLDDITAILHRAEHARPRREHLRADHAFLSGRLARWPSAFSATNGGYRM